MSAPTSLRDEINIRTEFQPGDFGYILQRHGRIYAEEYGYGFEFEAYVANGIYEFLMGYDPGKDRVWIAEHNGKIIGFILLMHRDMNTAQLRFFYLEKEYRGIGLGKELMSLFMDFLNLCGYESAYLWTTNELQAAASLYQRMGFALTEEKESAIFGKQVIEQKYDWGRKAD